MGEVVGQEPLHFQLENKPVRTKRIERLYEYVGASRVGMCLERMYTVSIVTFRLSFCGPRL
jgi:hypothetical protein